MTAALKIKTLGQVAERKAVVRYGMEDLAIQVSTSKTPSGGILFARNIEHVQKDEARQRILDLFSPANWPRSLHMLTMPGLHWRFERLLLGAREPGWMRRPQARRTFFTGVENDRAIYYAAVGQMPGLHIPGAVLKRTKPKSFAEMGIKTRYGAYYFANIDDLMQQEDCWKKDGWDAVWLDYTGQITLKQMRITEQFYQKYVRHILILTTMNGRWHTNTTNAIIAAGGYSNFLRNHLPGEVLHDLEYSDTVGMSQFAVRKPQKEEITQ